MTEGTDAQVEPLAGHGPGDEFTEDADGDERDPVSDIEASATGNVRVDEAVARLGELDALPTAEHADVYEDVHRRLHTALTELDAD